jgi:ribosomal protein L16 Arg81 hydroxylase
MMMANGFTLDDLIAPVTRDEFIHKYWEKGYFHIQRNDPDLFRHLFSLDDIDRWLAATRTGGATSVLITAPEGTQAGVQSYRPQEITVDKVYEAFAQGHSIILNQLEESWPPLSSLVKGLGRTFGGDVEVSVYVTPKTSRILPVHTDAQDVFILQVNGVKVWRLHEMKELAVEHLKHWKELVYPLSWGKARTQTPLLAELVLRPGDVLYVPRGMPHCAVARDETSLHLTVSVAPFYWVDFVKAALEQTCFRTDGLRRALPLGFLEDSSHREVMRHQFHALLHAFNESVSFDETLEVVTRNRIFNQGYPPDGHFSSLVRLSDLSLESSISRRESVLCAVESGSDFSCIRFGLRNVRGPAHLRRPLEFIRDHKTFKVSELPGLDDQSRLVLTRRLIREGFLRFAAPQANVMEAESILEEARKGTERADTATRVAAPPVEV